MLLGKGHLCEKNCVDSSCHVNENILSLAVSNFQVIKAVEMRWFDEGKVTNI